MFSRLSVGLPDSERSHARGKWTPQEIGFFG